MENNTPIKQAFLMADEVLFMGVEGISELITEPGEINIDFADVRTVMKGKGDALMGIGFGEGANRAADAARQAISNPLLENASISGAKSVLVNLTGSENLTLQEYQDVVELITEKCDPDALIIAGQAFDPELGDRIKVTVVATGFERKPEVVGSEKGLSHTVNAFAAPQAAPKAAKSESPAAHQPSVIEQTFNPVQERKPEAPRRPEPAQSPEGTITVNRWQDLQRQMSKGGAAGNDYATPAILRYSQEEDDRKR